MQRVWQIQNIQGRQIENILSGNPYPIGIDTQPSGQEEIEKEREKEHEDFLFQQTALENDRANVQAQLQALLLREMEADEMLESAYATAEICNQILSDQTTLNPDFLDFLEREGKKREKPFRKFVEIWYENFLNEYKDKLSDDNSNLQMELKQRMDNCSKVKKMIVRNLPYLKNEASTYTCGLFGSVNKFVS